MLKLRALGDLKSQKIGADDITKQYVDLESQLRAAKAMQERLMEIIKTGQGEVKDLLEAEKQLGVWREKIERLEGEIRYYDNLVSLSTLHISLMEKEIAARRWRSRRKWSMRASRPKMSKPRSAGDRGDRGSQGSCGGIESGETQRRATGGAGGGRCSAGQCRAVDRSAAATGRVPRMKIDRKTTTQDGQPVPPGVRMERHNALRDFTLQPGQCRAGRRINLDVAAEDVEVAYQAALTTIADAQGRVVTSQLNREQGQQTVGVLNFEIASAQAEGVLTALRNAGEVMKLSVSENPDTDNVTSTKRGLR